MSCLFKLTKERGRERKSKEEGEIKSREGGREKEQGGRERKKRERERRGCCYSIHSYTEWKVIET